jgi:hypothetical protein
VSLEAQRQFITGMFTNAGVIASDFPVLLPNITSPIPPNEPYGEFHIIGGGKPITLAGEGEGKVLNQYVGMVQLTVWIPEGKGTKPGTTIGDKFKDAFAGKVGRDSAQQTYEFGYMQEFTPQVNTGWTCQIFRVPFNRRVVEKIQVSI